MKWNNPNSFIMIVLFIVVVVIVGLCSSGCSEQSAPTASSISDWTTDPPPLNVLSIRHLDGAIEWFERSPEVEPRDDGAYYLYPVDYPGGFE